MVERVVTKQLAGVEDLTFGTSTVNQARASGTLPITQINASHVPVIDTALLLAATDVEAALAEIMAAVNVNTAGVASNLASIEGLTNVDFNGAFEIEDEVTATYPKDWTVAPYTGGTVALDATTSFKGKQSVKCTSTGTGGGRLTSKLLTVTEGEELTFQFSLKSSVVDVFNTVSILWYDKDEGLLSSSILYSESAANPTSFTTYQKTTQAPASAAYFAIYLVGCVSSDVTPGDTWFDGVSYAETFYLNKLGDDVASGSSITFLEKGNYHHITGTSTIVAIQALRIGALKTVEFDDVLTLTNGAGLLLPGGANIVTRAGDVATFIEFNTAQWKCLSYIRQDEAPDAVSTGAWETISSSVISSDATVEFTGLDDTYDEYRLVLDNIVPATNSVELHLEVGTGATPTWDTGANYEYNRTTNSSGNGAHIGNASSVANEIILVTQMGNAADESASGIIRFRNPEDSGSYTDFISEINAFDAVAIGYYCIGTYNVTTAVTAVRLLASAGNLATGTITLQGRVK